MNTVIDYRHEPFTDFKQEVNKQAMQQALDKVNDELGRGYPLIVGGEKIFTEERAISSNPAKKER